MKIMFKQNKIITPARNDRRIFLRHMGAVGLLASVAPFSIATNLLEQKLPEKIRRDKDTLSLQLYKSLSDIQKSKICLPASDFRREVGVNWWYLHDDYRIKNTFNKEQQNLIKQIFLSMHSEEHREKIYQQVVQDSYAKSDDYKGGGFGSASVGFFSEPDEDDFEFIFTGHHVTRRLNVKSDIGCCLSGPVFYGHQPNKDGFDDASHTSSAYRYQFESINEFYGTLNGQQREIALINGRPRKQFGGKPLTELRNEGFPGLKCSELSVDQKEFLLLTMKRMLSMFRKEDVNATMNVMRQSGWVDELHVAFYGGRYDIGSDQAWDVWQIESNKMIWYFSGIPHVHAYLNIKNDSNKLTSTLA